MLYKAHGLQQRQHYRKNWDFDDVWVIGYGNKRHSQQEICDVFNQMYPDRELLHQSPVTKILKKSIKLEILLVFPNFEQED